VGSTAITPELAFERRQEPVVYLKPFDEPRQSCDRFSLSASISFSASDGEKVTPGRMRCAV